MHWLEWRRIWAFAAVFPNHEHRAEGRFGPFSVSLRPVSLTQPNHARFGTVIGSLKNQ
jgi:hypothetical protein